MIADTKTHSVCPTSGTLAPIWTPADAAEALALLAQHEAVAGVEVIDQRGDR